MSLEVVWTKRASKDFENINDYILGDFGKSISEKFINRVYSAILYLEGFPQLGKFEFDNVYSLVIAKQTTMFYKLTDNHMSFLNYL